MRLFGFVLMSIAAYEEKVRESERDRTLARYYVNFFNNAVAMFPRQAVQVWNKTRG